MLTLFPAGSGDLGWSHIPEPDALRPEAGESRSRREVGTRGRHLQMDLEYLFLLQSPQPPDTGRRS